MLAGGKFVWLAMWVMAACGYPELPRLSGVDAPGDAPPQFSSCVGLATTCGPDGTEDCCRTALVPGGTFRRSDDAGAPATVSSFFLDTYEVTVGRFRAFLDAGMGTRASPPMPGAGAHPHLAESGWDSAWNASLRADSADLASAVRCSTDHATWTNTPGLGDSKPINCVTWYEALAFCIWDGGYLPTEAEWNYAASGGSEQRVYPWSKPASSPAIDCSYANYKFDPAGTYCANNPIGGVIRVGNKSPEGDGKWEHADLGGNVSEWTLDSYADPYPVPCDDCATLTASPDGVRRGGSFFVTVSNLRAAARDIHPLTDRNGSVGLRCARSP